MPTTIFWPTSLTNPNRPSPTAIFEPISWFPAYSVADHYSFKIFRCVLASLYEVVSVGWMDGWSVRNPFLDASSHLYKRVCPSVGPSVRPSVGPSVRWSVPLSSKTREINNFEQNIVIGGILGHLDASSQLYRTVYRSISLSVHWSVCDTSSNINLNKSKPE